MTSRITFLLIALFWVTMTYLLWRSEYVGQNQVGSNVPLELVWRKILTAPDNSSMQILHQGKKVGYCKWVSNIGQDLATGKILTDDVPPDGMVRQLTGYRLDFQGNLIFSEAPGRVKFDCDLKLTTNEVWQEFNLGVNLQKTVYKIHSLASEQTVRFETVDKRNRFEQVFRFSDLQNPTALIEELELPGAMEMLGAFGQLPLARTTNTSLLPEVKWTARNDWIAIGHTSVRAYRLEASLLDRYRMLVIVSRVGEILRVELPDDWELINDQLMSL